MPENLMSGHRGNAGPTYLPDDHPDMGARQELDKGSDLVDVACAYPASSYVWALLAQQELSKNDRPSAVAGYAYARTGYHRGLDALRRAGWRGQGLVPYSHIPNQGFLTALAMLAKAAERIGELDEAVRCREFLANCDPEAPSLA